MSGLQRLLRYDLQEDKPQKKRLCIETACLFYVFSQPPR